MHGETIKIIVIRIIDFIYFHSYAYFKGHAVAQLVETLRYKPEGRGFDWNFSLT